MDRAGIVGRRILLVVPPTGLYNREERNQAPVKGLVMPSLRIPLDLCTIAAVLQETISDAECKIVDCPAERISWLGLEKIMKGFHPDSLIISSTTFTLSQDLRAASIAKKLNPGILTVTKGSCVTVKDIDVLKTYLDLDVIMRGEYEITLQALATHGELKDILGITYRYNGQILRNPDRPFITDLDSLPFPARGLINNNLYLRSDVGRPMTTIQVGRGCPNACIFCLARLLSGRRVRHRTFDNIIAEIKECKDLFAIEHFFFRADTFVWDKEWVSGLCRRIVSEDLGIEWVCNGRVDRVDRELLVLMKKAGCRGIAFGVESGSQEILNKIGKNIILSQVKKAVELCKNIGIKCLLYFVIGMPWENEKHVLESIRFAKDLNADFVEFNIAVPFPGTKYYSLAKEMNLMISDNFEEYGYTKPIINTLWLSAKDLLRLRKRAILSLYLSPSYIVKILRNFRSPVGLCRCGNFAIKKLWNIFTDKH